MPSNVLSNRTEPKKIRTTPFRINDKHRRFIAEYLVDFNVTRASEAAGFKSAGHLLKIAEIQFEIQRLVLESNLKLEATGDDIRRFWANIVFDPRTTEHGGPELVERMAAAKELGKLMGLYIEKHVWTGATLEQLLAQAGEQEKTLPPPTPPLRLVSGSAP